MCYWKQWKKVSTKYKNLVKLGTTKQKAWEHANTRKSYWHTANSLILSTTIRYVRWWCAMKGTQMMKEGPSAGIVQANLPNNTNTAAVKSHGGNVVVNKKCAKKAEKIKQLKNSRKYSNNFSAEKSEQFWTV